jgi:PKD repeat protein
MYKTLTTGQQTTFPGADVATTADNLNFIFTKTFATNYNWIGLQGVIGSCNVNAVYSQQPVFYQFPTQFEGNFSNNSGFQQQIAGSCIGQAVDAVRATNTVTTKDTIDGWGKVTTPVGSYKCLRQKRIDYSTTLIEYRLLSFSPWSVLSTVRDTNVRYYYLTKEAKGSVITFDFDSIDQPIKATWSTVLPALCIADFGATINGGAVSFHDSTDGYPDNYSWNFGDGSATSSTQNPIHSYTSSGTYYVCLTVTNPSGTNMFCDSVHITNFAPMASNDTASMTQPGQVTINPTDNDSDPDNDPLCVTAVWGSPASWLTITGCNAVVYNPTDSVFSGLDTFFYSVCDNKSPQLCDTGMVVVNVAACAWPSANLTVLCTGSVVNHVQLCSLASTVFVNTSNVDSVNWTIHALRVGGIPDTVVHNADTLYLSSLRAAPNTIHLLSNIEYRLCRDIYSYCGMQTKCDTIALIWEGINEINPNAVKLYPNPAFNTLRIDLSALNTEDRSDITAIVLYDALGQKIQLLSYQQQSIMNTNITGLPPGIYTVCVSGQSNAKKTIGRVQILK